MAWRIEFDSRTEKELKRLDLPTRRRMMRFLAERVAPLKDPRSLGGPLQGPVLGQFWKYRVGDYRLICDIQDRVITIVVLRVAHRREVYR